jgi:hypothetical protein
LGQALVWVVILSEAKNLFSQRNTPYGIGSQRNVSRKIVEPRAKSDQNVPMQKKERFRMRFEESVKRETAKMSWPGHMSPILEAGAKSGIESWFAKSCDLRSLSSNKMRGIDDFGKWHKQAVERLARFLDDKKLLKPRKNNSVRDSTREYSARAVAAKLVDTFAHQLTKYPPFRHLYPHLHLPLDQVVRPKILALAKKLRAEDETLLSALNKNAYTQASDEYEAIQSFLWHVVDHELTEQVRRRYGRSRILLNPYFWAASD